MASRRSSIPDSASPSIGKENNNATYSPHSSSPQKIVGTKKARFPLEDCDPNSQDSGYGASYSERDDKSREGFRFAEPLAVAPRRTSIEARGSLESPQRVRVARPSLFRSLSSGYESMDDGFNDLIDIDTLDDATQLPNGISTLLSGDIVAAGSSTSGVSDCSSFTTESTLESSSSVTPEFSRTKCSAAGFRRSLSLQNDRPEKHSSTNLSKVRSCLFRSPNASSSTAKLDFEDGSPVAALPSRLRRRSSLLGFNVDYERTLRSPSSMKTFKRPDPPNDESPKLAKRIRRSSSGSGCNASASFLDVTPERIVVSCTKQPILQRSFSESATAEMTMTMTVTTMPETAAESRETETATHANIKSAIHRSTTDADLTGDFSKQCVLPLAAGNHEDLKSISVDTLAALIRGEFSDRIGSFGIVDCRYPYEFDAGHIDGAVNLYSKDLIERMLLDPLTGTPRIQPDTKKRKILVFHCEFSWERGPNLSRFLRNLDRQRNKEHYPALHYPEVYLLHGGYEQFYREQKRLCTPQGYRPMRDPDHEADLRQFRSKSKSWQGEKFRTVGNATRTNLKRLGF